MTIDPYRSIAAREAHDGGPGELYYAPRTTRMLPDGFGSVAAGVVLGAVGGVSTAHPVLGMSVGLAAGMLVGAFQRRRGDAAGILLRVRDGVLTIGRGKRSSTVLARAPLGDVLDVKVDDETLLASLGNMLPGPAFGMDPTNGRHRTATVEESRIAMVLRGRAEPMHLTVDRVSNADAMEELERIRRFLRAHGWRPADEEAESDEEARTLLATHVDGAEYTLRAMMRATAFVIEARRLGPGEGQVTTHEYVVGADDLPIFTERLLEASADPDRYAELDEGERLAEIVRDVFVTPHGIAAVDELTQWLDREGIAFGFFKP